MQKGINLNSLFFYIERKTGNTPFKDIVKVPDRIVKVQVMFTYIIKVVNIGDDR